MAPRKLSDADKQAAVELYKQPGETTSTIAAQFGVSNSTVSRLLKLLLPEAEYAELRSQKRSGNTDRSKSAAKPKPVKAKPVPEKAAEPVDTPSVLNKAAPNAAESDAAESDATESDATESDAAESDAANIATTKPTLSRRRSRRRSSASDVDQLSLMATDADDQADDQAAASGVTRAEGADTAASVVETASEKARNTPHRVSMGIDQFDDEDEIDEDDLVDEDDLDDLDDDLEDDLDDGDDDDDADAPLATAIQIMPLTETALPLTCYLVIDRLSELITRPLKEFAELAEIPSTDQSARTLPVFDNHRVARRFTRRNQRVIKVPNGQLLTKTRPYLQAKGINHLLIDGTLYSLLGD